MTKEIAIDLKAIATALESLSQNGGLKIISHFEHKGFVLTFSKKAKSKKK